MDISDTNLQSIKQLVEFINIQLHYPEEQSLKCKFRLLNYKSQEGDRIAIYKLGWNTVKDYTVFEWVPVNDAKQNTVVFNHSVLPKHSTDMFQFCYISSENRTYGVSEPFQFTNTSIKLPTLDCLRSLCSDSEFCSLNGGQEMLKLKEENKFFRDKLQTFMNMLINTQTLLCQQQREINKLKERCDQLEGNNRSLNLRESRCNKSLRKSCGSLVCNDFDIGELETLPPFPFAK